MYFRCGRQSCFPVAECVYRKLLDAVSTQSGIVLRSPFRVINYRPDMAGIPCDIQLGDGVQFGVLNIAQGPRQFSKNSLEGRTTRPESKRRRVPVKNGLVEGSENK